MLGAPYLFMPSVVNIYPAIANFPGTRSVNANFANEKEFEY
jgi:hypothetical protein